MYSFMIAVGENNEMGVDNHIPWHLPSEIQYFRKVTEWHTIIMGRKTFESLPKVLPNRRHIVLTKDMDYKVDHPDVIVVNSLDEARKLTSENEEYFVIGGAEIFLLFLPYTQRVYLTVVHSRFKADTYFIDLNMAEWNVSKMWDGVVDKENRIPHTYYILDRKS